MFVYFYCIVVVRTIQVIYTTKLLDQSRFDNIPKTASLKPSTINYDTFDPPMTYIMILLFICAGE